MKNTNNTIDIVMSQLFQYSRPTFFRWKKEKRPIISLLEKYFSKEDLQEFLKTQKIKKLEKAKFIQKEVYEINHLKYFDSFSKKSLKDYHPDFQIFYFNFLKELYKANQNNSEIDNFIFNEYFYTASFQQLINTFLVYYIKSQQIDTKKAMLKTFILYKYFDIFEKWDSYMLLFLKECLDNNLKNLFEPHEGNYSIPNHLIEAIYHISGFYLFTSEKYKKLNDNEKFEFLSEIFKKYIKQFESMQSVSPDIDIILDKLFPGYYI